MPFFKIITGGAGLNIFFLIKNLKLCLAILFPVLSKSARKKQIFSSPTKADFRESGGFEQEAAVMLGLYREDYYDKQTTQKGIFEVSVLKSRFSSETTVNKIV
ncbi:MAG: DnaB-like helicase C-terminal domain-containing protein [Nostoc sp.]